MNEFQKRVFMEEVRNQAEAARIAADGYNSAVLAPAGPDVSHAFAAAQSLLAAGAMLSKLLWPTPAALDKHGARLVGEAEESRQRTLQRGRELRAALSVKSLPIIEKRAVRNAFEHFDDRLDQVLEHETVVVDRQLAPAGAVRDDSGPVTTLRSIDPATNIVRVLDDSVNVQDLMTAIMDLGVRADDWLEAH